MTMITKLTINKWMGFLINLKENHEDYSLHKLSRRVGIAYDTAHCYFTLFKNKKLITVKKIGRRNHYEFTEKGDKMYFICKKIIELIK